jgi:hypothetical protein
MDNAIFKSIQRRVLLTVLTAIAGRAAEEIVSGIENVQLELNKICSDDTCCSYHGFTARLQELKQQAQQRNLLLRK